MLAPLSSAWVCCVVLVAWRCSSMWTRPVWRPPAGLTQPPTIEQAAPVRSAVGTVGRMDGPSAPATWSLTLRPEWPSSDQSLGYREGCGAGSAPSVRRSARRRPRPSSRRPCQTCMTNRPDSPSRIVRSRWFRTYEPPCGSRPGREASTERATGRLRGGGRAAVHVGCPGSWPRAAVRRPVVAAAHAGGKVCVPPRTRAPWPAGRPGCWRPTTFAPDRPATRSQGGATGARSRPADRWGPGS